VTQSKEAESAVQWRRQRGVLVSPQVPPPWDGYGMGMGGDGSFPEVKRTAPKQKASTPLFASWLARSGEVKSREDSECLCIDIGRVEQLY
jgi:hypothetical protein